jgi:hypothetical protein
MRGGSVMAFPASGRPRGPGLGCASKRFLAWPCQPTPWAPRSTPRTPDTLRLVPRRAECTAAPPPPVSESCASPARRPGPGLAAGPARKGSAPWRTTNHRARRPHPRGPVSRSSGEWRPSEWLRCFPECCPRRPGPPRRTVTPPSRCCGAAGPSTYSSIRPTIPRWPVRPGTSRRTWNGSAGCVHGCCAPCRSRPRTSSWWAPSARALPSTGSSRSGGWTSPG